MSIQSDLFSYITVLGDLRRFLRTKVSYEEASDKILGKEEKRDENFLHFVKRGVYENRNSPFLKLLKSANLEFEDVRSLVKNEGVEGALDELLGNGVYITLDEFKGKADCVRNGKTFRFDESDFDNTLFRSGLETTTGGTRSAGTRVVINFNALADGAENYAVFYKVHNLLDSPKVIWLPVGLGLTVSLTHIKIGNTPVEWFSQIKWSPTVGRVNFYSVFKNSMMSKSVIYGAKMMGIDFPRMKSLNFEGTETVCRSISKLAKENSVCCVMTYPSSALRACKIAAERGIDIDGTVFIVGGEPLTPAKRKEIEKAGAGVIPFYAASETGTISFGCGKQSHCDDTHLMRHELAMIQYKREVMEGKKVDAFLLSSLSPEARKFLINVEIGDCGVIKRTDCGCGYGKLGFRDIIYNIRSFEKLTGEGMTLIGSDMVEVIEDDLPAMFGGSSTDYQLVEDEDEKGFTHMDVLVSPEVGKVDGKKVVDAVYEGLARRSKVRNESFDVWKDAGTIRVKREKPIITRGGKIFSFQISRIKKK
jgi:hypothetical protein